MNNQTLYNAHYHLLQPVPSPTTHGESLLLPIQLTNPGPIPWFIHGPHPVRLSYHWQTTQGQTVVDDGLRTGLPQPVPPGTQITVEMRVESPPEPGDYQLVVDLVEEGFGWFSEKQVPPLVLPVTCQPASGKRASIINGNCVIHDAVGNHVVAQLYALRNAGYHTLLITEHIDGRLPLDVRRSAVALKLPDLHHPDRRHQWVTNHLFSSDIVVLTYSTYYQLAEVIKQIRNAPIIFDYHGITPPEFWVPNTPGYDDLVQGYRNITLVQYADYAIARSGYMRQELLATGLIAPENVFVTPLGMPEEACPTTTHSPEPEPEPDAALRERYHLDGKKVLLYVGRMARNKRLTDLVEALALVVEQHPDAVLLLVGDNQFGSYREYASEVQQHAEALGCDQHLIFTGQVPRLEPYYRLCDLFVTASLHEGFCMPVVEAMSHGKPVVATNITALPETIDGGGLLCEPRNPPELARNIIRLLDSIERPADTSRLIQTPATDEELAALRQRPIVLVSPRYGLEIIGGMERHLRGWAEELTARGYPVEVLTTCTADMGDWSNHFAPGVEAINGVTVRRFATDRVEAKYFHQVQGKANRGEYVSHDDELDFMHNNLRSSAMEAYLRQHSDDYACVIFGPYLFGTTYWGMQAVPGKALLLPGLHDERAAYFPIFREMFEGFDGLLFSTRAESELAYHTLGVQNPHYTLVGYGFAPETNTGNAQRFRARYAIQQLYLLYSGRLESGKNVPLLLEYFTRYKEQYPGPLALLLTGSGDVPIPDRPDIIPLGVLPEEALPDVFAAALALCQPSLNEGFSIVIMESWLQGRPVMVHQQCAVTRDHVAWSGGGYAFNDYAEFSTALHRLLHDPHHADSLGQRGMAYVLERYTWDAVIDRLLQGIVALTRPRSEYRRLAQRGIQRSLALSQKRFRDSFVRVVKQAQEAQTVQLSTLQQQQLSQLTQVGLHEYTIQSRLPVVGKFVAWVRRQMTAHLKEPYLDPMIARQETFNTELLQTLLPLLEHSMYEQRRLKREVAILRERLARQHHDESRPYRLDDTHQDIES